MLLYYCYFKQSYWFQRYPVHVCIFLQITIDDDTFIAKMYILGLSNKSCESSIACRNAAVQWSWKSCRKNALRSDDFMFRRTSYSNWDSSVFAMHFSPSEWQLDYHNSRVKNMLLAAARGILPSKERGREHLACFPPILDVKNVKIFGFIFDLDSVYLFLGASNSEFKLLFIHYRNCLVWNDKS